LAGLQYIFVTPQLNEAVFTVLERHILAGKRSTGRLGMSLWEILVLGTMRLNLDLDYDTLYDLANHHEVVRGIMGVHTRKVFEDGKYYALQTMKDNVALLDEQALEQISELVVKAGHQLKKNAATEGLDLRLKSDTYPVQANVHFPTDLNLLWDSIRKSLDTMGTILKEHHLGGWRKLRYWYKTAKKAYRRAANIHQKKGKNYQQRLEQATDIYLSCCRKLAVRLQGSILKLEATQCASLLLPLLLEELKYYHKMLLKHLDLLDRRILQGEKIPHSEKVFSIFEPHVEWLQKGKPNNQVELGHNVLVTTDQFGFIVDHKVLEKEVDSAQPIPLTNRLCKRFTNEDAYRLHSISFDRGFHSALAQKALEKHFEQVVMPRKGKKSTVQQQEEQAKTFVALRKAHSAVESNINELEHSGVNRVPDRGLNGFKKYVAMGVLAYNLKRLGAVVIEQNLLDTLVPLRNRKRAA
ncbi:MAG: ISNCY family transposase, partial [Bacteroidota bacterium]